MRVLVGSFYLELRITIYASTQTVVLYSIDVKNALPLVWADRLAPFPDPDGRFGHDRVLQLAFGLSKFVVSDELEDEMVRAARDRSYKDGYSRSHC